jgi:hypothetical protein
MRITPVRVVDDRDKEPIVTLCVVSTGGDPGHAPARATYERNGFVAFPQVLDSTLL